MADVEDETHFDPYRADGKLYGFVCVVTGVDYPIGKAITAELAIHGAACIYACAQSTRDNTLAADLAKAHPNTKIIPHPLPVADEQETLALIDDILNDWGRLDVWVASSGVLGPHTVAATSPADLQRSFAANAMAPFFALKYAPPAMKKTTPRGNYPNATPKDVVYGSIIVVSSVAAAAEDCAGPCFTMSSHAALGAVKAGVSALKGSGIRVNCISTAQVAHPLDSNGDAANGEAALSSQSVGRTGLAGQGAGANRAGRPSEVARVAGFLASGFSRGVTGANIVVDMF